MNNESAKKVKKAGVIVGIPLAVILTFTIGYGELKNKVKVNSEAIKKVETVPVEVGVIKVKMDVVNRDIAEIKDNMEDLHREQKVLQRDVNSGFEKVNEKINDGFKEIMQAIR
jgi:chromosome segregation ATPase